MDSCRALRADHHPQAASVALLMALLIVTWLVKIIEDDDELAN
eukprot:jgi/Mesen1/4181/ME000219S03310